MGKGNTVAQTGSSGLFKVGWLLLKGSVIIATGAGAPVSGTSGTGVGKAGPGSIYIDLTNKTMYQNTNTKASPTWTQIAGSGLLDVAGVAAGYKVARGVAAITGSGTVVTGLATVVAVVATPSSDLDGVTLAGVSGTIGNQAGAPAAGSVILKCWKVTAVGDATMIAADAAKNVNWIAIGT